MQPGIQCEGLLQEGAVIPPGGAGEEHQVPAVPGDGAGDEDDRMLAKQSIAEVLLAATGDAGYQPVLIGDILGMNDLDPVGRENLHGGEHMRYGVQGAKSLVNRDLQDGGSRVQRAVDGAHAFPVPAAAKAERAFTAVPRLGVLLLIQPPGHQPGWSKRVGKEWHV